MAEEMAAVTDDGFEEGSAAADIAAALDAQLSQQEPANEEPPPAGVEPPPEPPAGGEPPPAAAGKDQPPIGQQPGEQPPPAAANAAAEQPPATDAPPSSLSPAAREAWKDTPQAVKDDVAKREADYERGIMQYAEDARRAQGMDAVLRPHAQYLAMNGNNPAKSVSELLQTASILQMGSPAQKANMVANLVQQFGVDINALDGALSQLYGGQPQQQQASPYRQELEQQLAPIRQFMQQVQHGQQQQEHQRNTAVQQEVQAFASDPANEFYRDVANDMAMLMELGARSNPPREYSLKQAYDEACRMHPQIGPIMAARKAAPTAQQQAAAASVSGHPGGAVGKSDAEPGSLREALERAIPQGDVTRI